MPEHELVLDGYELVRDIGAGNFGVARLMCNKKTKELVAVKLIERGEKIDDKVAREIMIHRSLQHPNIVRFLELVATPTHLAIVMEYAAGGELYSLIRTEGRFSEAKARFFFQQLIYGVSYCHSMEICHRDLKLENALLDGKPTPRLKICDFGFSKSTLMHSQPKSMVGTPGYIAPEVWIRKDGKYDGKLADVWSCGVTLYAMMVGAFPFEDPDNRKDIKETVLRTVAVKYSIPDDVHMSRECRQFLSRIFVFDPTKRITIKEIKEHDWFLTALPSNLVDGFDVSSSFDDPNHPPQSVVELMRIIEECKVRPGLQPALTLSEKDMEADDDDFDFVCKLDKVESSDMQFKVDPNLGS